MKAQESVIAAAIVVVTVVMLGLVIGVDARQMAWLKSHLWVCALAVPAFLALGFVASLHMQGQAAGSWEEVAREHGLAFTRGGMGGLGWAMRGAIDGVAVAVATEVRRSGDKRRVVTVVSADLGAGRVPAGLRIAPERLRDKLAKVVGGQDVEVGLPELDARLRFRGRSDGEVRAFARRAGAATPLRLLAEHDGFEVDGELARVESPGLVLDGRQLATQLDDLVALALAARNGA